MKNKVFPIVISICFVSTLFLPGIVKTAGAEDGPAVVSQDNQLPDAAPIRS